MSVEVFHFSFGDEVKICRRQWSLAFKIYVTQMTSPVAEARIHSESRCRFSLLLFCSPIDANVSEKHLNCKSSIFHIRRLKPWPIRTLGSVMAASCSHCQTTLVWRVHCLLLPAVDGRQNRARKIYHYRYYSCNIDFRRAITAHAPITK